MNLPPRWSVITVSVLILCCVSSSTRAAEPVTGAPAKKKPTKAILPFDRTALAKVLAVRFKIPGEGTPAAEHGFSFIRRGDENPDFSRLKELTVKEAVLTPTQVELLIQCIYGTKKKTWSAACYDPHHLFLFYNASGEVINAVELCFSCTNISASPGIPESLWQRHNFRKLARLCDECGIGLGTMSAEDYIKAQDERDKQ